MNSFKKILNQIKSGPGKANRDLILELAEINEITEKLVRRIENKIKDLKTIETQADQKIAILDGLISRIKNMNPSLEWTAANEVGHQGEVRALSHKGFNPEQIARILDLPSGEVELILNMVH
jgi:superfamily I DNA/RNA helicase